MALYDLQMNVPIGWASYKTIDGLLFIGQVARYIPFLSNLDGMFEFYLGFCGGM